MRFSEALTKLARCSAPKYLFNAIIAKFVAPVIVMLGWATVAALPVMAAAFLMGEGSRIRRRLHLDSREQQHRISGIEHRNGAGVPTATLQQARDYDGQEAIRFLEYSFP